MGIKINNNFELLDDRDDGYIVDDRLVRGGYKVAANPTERDSIPMASRKMGMTVFVNSLQKEFHLVGGITNSSWQEKVLTGISLPEYAKLSNATFTGVLSNMWGVINITHPISYITSSFEGDNDIDKLLMQITPTDLQYIGELSVIRGTNSGATAVVVYADSTGLLIPSKTANILLPEYRAGDFIQGEKITITPGPALARRPQDVMTRHAVEALTITKYGGSVYNNINSWPIFRYTTKSKVIEILDHNALNIVEIKMSSLVDDIKYLYNNMKIITPRNDIINTLGLTSNGTGFLISAVDKSKIKVNDVFQIIDGVVMPTEPQHLAAKQYVDDATGRTILNVNSSYFTNMGVVSDPTDNNTAKQLYSFTIPGIAHSKRWPLVDIYQVVLKGTTTDYVRVNNNTFKHVIRETVTGSDIVIQVWSASPVTLRVIIH